MFTAGFGERTVRTQSAGGGSNDLVTSVNAEMQYSKLKFALINTNENIQLARDLQAALSNNAIEITDVNTDFDATIASAIVTNDVEYNLGADTTIDIEMTGRKATV